MFVTRLVLSLGFMHDLDLSHVEIVHLRSNEIQICIMKLALNILVKCTCLTHGSSLDNTAHF